MGGIPLRRRIIVKSSKARRIRGILLTSRQKSWQAFFNKYGEIDNSSSANIVDIKEYTAMAEDDNFVTSINENLERQFESQDNTLKNNNESNINILKSEKKDFCQNPDVGEKCCENSMSGVLQNEFLRERDKTISEVCPKGGSTKCVTTTVHEEDGYKTISETCLKYNSVKCGISTVNFNVLVDSSSVKRQDSVRKTAHMNVRENDNRPHIKYVNVSEGSIKTENCMDCNSEVNDISEGLDSSYVTFNKFNTDGTCNGSSPSNLEVNKIVGAHSERPNFKNTKVNGDINRRWKDFIERPGKVWYPFQNNKRTRMPPKTEDFESILNKYCI